MPNPPILIDDFNSLNATISVGVNDSGEVNYLRTDPSGSLIVSATVRQINPSTFVAVASGTVIGLNKSMISIYNEIGSNYLIKIKKIHLINVQTSAVTGVTSEFRMHRISTHSLGNNVLPNAYDTNDIIDPNITVRTGATVSEGVFIKRQFLSTDETAAGGGTDLDQLVAFLQTSAPFFSEYDYSKPFVLRAGQGIHIRHATNSVSGTFDIEIVFTTDTTL